MYRSVISNLIGSICSPHLQRVSVKLVCLVGDVEHFPWGVVNSLTKVSPYTLQKVEIALQLRVETDADWGITSLLSPSEYESYFCQVRLALPELDEKVIISIAVRHSSRLFLISYAYDRLAHCRTRTRTRTRTTTGIMSKSASTMTPRPSAIALPSSFTTLVIYGDDNCLVGD